MTFIPNAEDLGPFVRGNPMPTVLHATGSQNIDETFKPGRSFRLVFVRIHFYGGQDGDIGNVTLTLDSGVAEDHDVLLYTYRARGQNRDMNLALAADETMHPSPWSFSGKDAIRVQWTNPRAGTLKWGIELGYA